MAIDNTEINSLEIVEECFAIANAVDKANKEAHDPKKEYDDKKTYLKYLRGKIWLEYKTGKRAVDGLEGKITDKAVESAVDSDEEYLKACKEMNEAYHNFMVADDYASAMEGKRKGLELITKYVLGGWFSELQIADVSSIENFAKGGTAKEDPLGGRRALREKRRAKRGEEDDDDVELL